MAEAVASAPIEPQPFTRPGAARLIALLLPAALLAGAFGSQYFGRLYPCELCWWQRYAHMVALVPALLAISPFMDARRSRLFVLLAALAIAVSGGIAVYHAGVELKIFPGFTTCTSTAAAGGSTAEMLRKLTEAPLVRCDQIQWSLLGVSLAGWNAIISLGGAALIAFLTLRERAR
jgi:disulfide bond formation protein DsbB